VRLTALAALPDGLPRVDAALFDFLRDHLKTERPVSERGFAAATLARAKLDAKQLLTLAQSLKTAGPMEADRLLDAFANSSDETVGNALIDALKSPKARAWMSPEAVRPRLAKFSPAVRKEAEAIFATLGEDVTKQQARLDDLLKTLPAGDVRRGQAVFNSPKAACATCHTIGYLGGKVGPDLTRIGSIRTERDLLESIVFPNASFVRGYEPVYVRTQDGKTFNGILRKDAPDEIILVPAADKEERIAREDIDEMRPGRISVMPSGLDQQLSRQELADLVAFLKASK
jgi:putative heme-binding domain-containing protein